MSKSNEHFTEEREIESNARIEEAEAETHSFAIAEEVPDTRGWIKSIGTIEKVIGIDIATCDHSYDESGTCEKCGDIDEPLDFSGATPGDR